MAQALDIVILAAGQGTRMRSSQPKVLHRLAGRSLLRHVVDTASELEDARMHVVIGHGADAVRESLQHPAVDWTVQDRQLGTGHAVQQVADKLSEDGRTLVLYADVPLIRADTLRSLVALAADGDAALLTVELPDPSGYGRILRDEDNNVCAIVEDRDASAQQRAIAEINTGIMVLPTARLLTWLDALENDNAQGEYYLTDVISMAVGDGVAVHALQAQSPEEVAGVNSRAQLAELERHYQRQQAQRMMDAGVSFADPARFDLRGSVDHGQDIFIDVDVVLEGTVVLGDGAHIAPGCVIRDSSIGSGSTIHPNSVIEESQIGANCNVGPFARLRPLSQLADGAKIGNFVETKKSLIGPGSKVNHLSYVGDSTLGEKVNVGAGTITCNYDGANKHHTDIGDGAFIGSNTSLVAPVEIGKGATVAAGSVVTSKVPDDHLAVARGKQRNIEGWQRPVKKPKT